MDGVLDDKLAVIIDDKLAVIGADDGMMLAASVSSLLLPQSLDRTKSGGW